MILIDQIFVGKGKKYSFYNSAIEKGNVDSGYVSLMGLEEDTQCFEKHGGADRALHYYPAEHYDFWREKYPDLEWKAGLLGENLSGKNLMESDVRVGDIYKCGGTLLQVSMPRKPCFKVSKRTGISDFKEMVIATGKCGWFFRVLQEGYIKQGDNLKLITPGDKEMAINVVFPLIYQNSFISQMIALEDYYLAEEWKEFIREIMDKSQLPESQGIDCTWLTITLATTLAIGTLLLY